MERSFILRKKINFKNNYELNQNKNTEIKLIKCLFSKLRTLLT